MRFLQIFVSVFLSLVLALDLNDTLRLRYLNNQDYIQFGLTFQTKEIVSRNIYNYLPRQIANLIFENDISNFEMSLSRGDWYYDVDLEDPHFSDYIFGHGGFLKAKSKSGAFSDSVWTKFTNSLGGMTCASFNQITSVVTGVDSEGNYFGQLPVEAICTENLTPWKKLLLGGCGNLLNEKF